MTDSDIFVIESDDYRKEVELLKKDPIIKLMASTCPRSADFDSWSFISAASNHYHACGGMIAHTIGGPARAIKELLREDTT